jgi:hypothetical protein
VQVLCVQNNAKTTMKNKVPASHMSCYVILCRVDLRAGCKYLSNTPKHVCTLSSAFRQLFALPFSFSFTFMIQILILNSLFSAGARTFDPPIERPANRTRPPPTVSGGLTIPAPPLGNGSSISTPVNPVAPASIPPPGGNERLQQLRAEMNALAQQRRAEAPALAQAAQPRPTEAVTSSTATAAALVTASAAPKPLSRQQVPPSPLDRANSLDDVFYFRLALILTFFSQD